MAVIKNKSTERGRKFWEHVETIAAAAEPTCGALSPKDGLRDSAVCVKPKGHASYHGTTTEDVRESAHGYFWHGAKPAQATCLCPVNWFESKGFHFVSCPLLAKAVPSQAVAEPTCRCLYCRTAAAQPAEPPQLPDDKLEALSNEWHSSGYVQKWEDFIFSKLLESYSDNATLVDTLREAQGARDRQYEYNVEQIAKQAVLEAELSERIGLAQQLTVDNATLRDWVTRLQESKRRLEAELKRLHTLRPASEWHEDYGTVLWHHLPIQEPPHVGTPLDSDWDYYDEGYYTHWSPIPMNPELASIVRDKEGEWWMGKNQV